MSRMAEVHAIVEQFAEPPRPINLRRAIIFARMAPAVMYAMGELVGRAAIGCEGTAVERATRANALLDTALDAFAVELERMLAREAEWAAPVPAAPVQVAP